jgi:hypothetical protein
VRAALVRVDGFQNMRPDYDAQQVTVVYDPKKTSPEALAKAINAGTHFRASAPPS